MLKQKIIKFLKHILLKMYFKLDRLDNTHSKIYNEYVRDSVMAEFYY